MENQEVYTNTFGKLRPLDGTESVESRKRLEFFREIHDEWQQKLQDEGFSVTLLPVGSVFRGTANDTSDLDVKVKSGKSCLLNNRTMYMVRSTLQEILAARKEQGLPTYQVEVHDGTDNPVTNPVNLYKLEIAAKKQ